MGRLVDPRHAIRSLRCRPGLAAFAIAILAITIGAATAVFSLVNAVLLRELPFHDPDRLVWMWNARLERDRAPFAVLDLDDYRAQNHVLESLAGFMNWTVNLTGIGETERLEAIRVAPDFFDVLGAQAALGRVLHQGDDPEERVVVITDRLWRRKFGADPAVVGRMVDLSGARYAVVGVLPPGFVFPFRDAELAAPLPLTSDPRAAQRSWGLLRVVARLKPGVTLAAAKRDLDAIGHRLQQQYPVDDAKRTGVNLYPLQQEIVGDARQLLFTLMAAVIFVLLVGAANVANLLLVWLAERRGEFEISAALGASRGRLIAQIATEAGALVLAGGVVSLWFASLLIETLVWWTGGALPRVAGARLDGPSVGFAAFATAVAALVCAIVPAVHATDSFESVSRNRSTTATPDRQRLRRAFIATQMAIAVVLLTAIGLTVRSLVNLQRVNLGFQVGGTLSVQLSLPPARYGSSAALGQLADRLTPRLRSLPGVRSAAAVSLLPLSGLLRAEDFRVIGRPDPPPNEMPQAHFRVVTPGYFGTMGNRLADGREFTDDDRPTTARVAIVNQTLANQYWRGASPLGAHVRLGNGTEVEIVGVTTDVKQLALDAAPTADLYVPLRQMPETEAPIIASRMFWVVAAGGDPVRLVDDVRAQVRALDADIATSGVRTMSGIVGDLLAPRRFNATALAAFAQIAVLLAATGLYAVTAFSVQQRTKEIGLRMALGARRGDVMRLVLGSEWRAIAVGTMIGVVAAWVAARLLASTLFQVRGIDPATLLGSLVVLLVMAAAGCYVPARRAAAVDPAQVLR